jgi:hypothetical protein
MPTIANILALSFAALLTSTATAWILAAARSERTQPCRERLDEADHTSTSVLAAIKVIDSWKAISEHR